MNLRPTKVTYVPRTRLELARRKPTLPPQSSVSTNFTIWALYIRYEEIHFIFKGSYRTEARALDSAAILLLNLKLLT